MLLLTVANQIGPAIKYQSKGISVQILKLESQWDQLIWPPRDHEHVPPQRLWFLRCFGQKTGLHFAHFGLESGMVFEGTTGVHERIYRFNSKWVRKKENYANLK